MPVLFEDNIGIVPYEYEKKCICNRCYFDNRKINRAEDFFKKIREHLAILDNNIPMRFVRQ